MSTAGEDEGAPGAPTDLQAVEEAGLVVLSWEAPEDEGNSSITLYNILRGDSDLNLELLRTMGGTTFTDNGVERSKTYFYAVSAQNSNGTGPISNIVSVEVPEEAAEGVGGLPWWVVITIFGIVAVLFIIMLLRAGGKKGGPEAMAPMGKEPEPETVVPPVMAEQATKDTEGIPPVDRTTP